MTREERDKGFFVSFDYTTDALREIDRFFRSSRVGSATWTVCLRPEPDPEDATTLACDAEGAKTQSMEQNGKGKGDILLLASLCPLATRVR